LAGSDDRWKGDRRTTPRDRRAGDRRSGADRRIEDRGRPEGDRRSQKDRRQGDRRSGRDRRDEAAWKPVAIEAAGTGTYDDAALVAAAIDAREFARAQFSGFKVGAALETDLGTVVTGCNVENATYGLTMCAERVALYKALSQGKDLLFARIVVVADTDDPTPPCGSCRQLLWEYCGDIEVVLANLSEVKRRMRLSQLLPLPFDVRLLE
jgi:cytidine deaminase